jgi:hypothetical protein
MPRRVASLGEAWTDYCAAVLGPFGTADEIRTARDAFYSGAGAVLALLLEQPDVGRIEELRRDVAGFVNESTER